MSKDGENINFEIDFKMPYISRDDEHKIKVKVVGPDSENNLDSKYIKNDKFSISVDSLDYGESILMMTYQSEGMGKEYYLKTVERKSYSYEDYDVDIARGKSSYLRLIKRKKGKSNFIIEEVEFEDGDWMELKGTSDNNIENILIKDYLDFVEFKYPINYKKLSEREYEFSIK